MTESRPEADPYRIGVRVVKTGSLLSLVGGGVAWPTVGWRLAVSLTVASLVVIVHVLWLERFLSGVLTGTSPQFQRSDGLKIFGQFLLLGAIVAGAYLWPGFSPAGAVVGVTIAILAVGIEGARAGPKDE